MANVSHRGITPVSPVVTYWVTDYGAVGDGVADDLAAINAADVAARAANATLNFPPGTYRISAALTIDSGSHWVGHGEASIKHLGTTLHGFVSVTSKSDITFEQLKFDGDMSNITTYAAARWDRTHAFDFINCTNIVFRRCEFTAIRGPNIEHQGCVGFELIDCYIHDTDNWAIVGKNATDVEYLNNYVADIYTIGLHVSGAAATGSLRVRMIGNTVLRTLHDAAYANSGVGITVHTEAGVTTQDVELIGNYARSNGSMGFSLTPAEDHALVGKMVVSGNISEDHTADYGAGYELQGQNITFVGNISKNNLLGVILQKCTHVTLGNNVILAGIGSTNSAIMFQPANVTSENYNININNNYIEGGTNALHIVNTATTDPHRRITIQGNQFYGNGFSIFTQVAVTDIKIINNFINNDVVGVASNGRGIYITNGTNVEVSGNTITPASGANGISFLGVTNFTAKNNLIIGGANSFLCVSGTTTGCTMGGNICQSPTTADRSGFSGITAMKDENTNSWNRGTAAPASGYWAVGSIVYDTAVAAGGFVGFVCTTAGTPGTWKTFGAVSP